jgi:hypothetical protein
MNLLKLLALLFGARVKTQRRNDNLRAGQYPEPAVFSPWIAMVS